MGAADEEAQRVNDVDVAVELDSSAIRLVVSTPNRFSTAINVNAITPKRTILPGMGWNTASILSDLRMARLVRRASHPDSTNPAISVMMAPSTFMP